MHVDIVIHAGWFVAKNPSERMDMGKNFSPLVNTHYLLSHLPNIPERIIFCSSTDVYGGTGTDEVFENGEVVNERSPISLVTLYGLAKYNTELLVSDWAQKHGIEWNILRLGPLYGAGDKRKNFLVGAMLKQAAEGRRLSLYADKSMRRNLLYVDDCAKFIVRSVDTKELPKTINVVSSQNPTMREIVEAICSASGNTVDYDMVEGVHKGKDLAYDASVRECFLGKENYTLESGMKAAFEWNQSYYA